MQPLTLLALSSLAGAGIQAYGQYRTNSANAAYQDEANRLSVDLANTAHQREVADLRAAGLNPILSAGGSGSQTPSLGAVQASNPYAGLGNSAASVGRELARYTNDIYAGQVAGMAIDNESASSALDVQREQDKIDALLLRNKRRALEDYFEGTVRDYRGKKNKIHINSEEFKDKHWKQFDDLVKEGLISDLKVGANQNWRNNLSSFMPFVNSLNSAASVGLGVKRLNLEQRRMHGNGAVVYR